MQHQEQGQPLVSIITVVLNGADSISKTVESVLKHKTPTTEYIVLDGGSTDQTMEVLAQYEAEINKLISAPDKGIYDAMNKGWDMATGKYLLNLNNGDELLHLPEHELLNAWEKGADVVSFQVKLGSSRLFCPKLGFPLRINNTLHHQGTFYNRDLPLRYNLRYRVFADFDLNQRLYKQACRIELHHKTISKHGVAGISHNKAYFGEVYAIIAHNFGWWYKCLAFLNFKLLGLQQWIRKK